MTGLYDVAAVRAAEAQVMAALPDGALMERAATGLAAACAGLLTESSGGMAGRRIVVLAGSGNNGGDALFAGAQLARRGALVEVVCTAATCHGEGLAALLSSGGRSLPLDRAGAAIDRADLVLDGIVGIGGRGGLQADAAALAEAARQSGALVVAVDVPSGVDASTGAVTDRTAVIDADVTVTFGCLKQGLLLSPGREHAGTIVLVDIGLKDALPTPTARVLDSDDLAAAVPEPGPDDYKYSRGVVGIAAGSARYRGAAFMATASARHGNVGMVHVVDRGDGVAHSIVDEFWDVVVSTDAPASVSRATAWTVGPGLGVDADGRHLLSEVLRAECPVIVDADALRMLRDDAPWVALQQRSHPTVVTPHLGEFAALGYAVGAGAQEDRLAAARRAAAELGVIVVLKGPGTVIAAPSGMAYIDTWGTAELGTAGSGDVLAGLIGALLAGAAARGECATDDQCAEVAAAAVGLHGIAGRRAGADGRPVTAPDIIEQLPAAIGGVRRGSIT